MKSEPVEVYVYLLNEGTDVWRPTMAEVLGAGRYRLLPTEGYDPDIEEWEFVPGTVVHCEVRGEKGLVATRAANGS